MPEVQRIVDHGRQQHEASLRRICEWLAIPSVGTDPQYADDTRRAGQWAVDRLREVGVDASLRETGTPEQPGHPIVWAQHEGDADYQGPHILFYGHYDVQPPDPLELWESEPFTPVVKPAGDGMRERIVARGACDDKGQVASFLEALRAWHEIEGRIPVKMTILIEGEEESGSANLEKFIRENESDLKQADVCVISDTGMLGPNSPAITYGVRGLAYTQITLHASNQDLHSGMWGGRCQNPITELSKIVAQLWDEDRRVTIPGFYDGVRTLPDEVRQEWAKLGFDQLEALRGIGMGPEGDVGEKGFSALEREWARPTCELNGIWGGYTGAGAKTVIPSHASAKVSFRLVDDQDPEAITRSFEKWLQERTPAGCRWEFEDLGGGAPATVSSDSPYLQAARRALSDAGGGTQAALIKTGGSIPVVGFFKSMLGIDSVMMGFGLEDDRVHSPNEKFDVECFTLGIESHIRLLDELVKLGSEAVGS
jgi:acetylornithine deacetylase/succinyl-diaminopimelate desuccinylase-like protein